MAEAMYGEFAEWWPLLSKPPEYQEEAGFYTQLLREACNPTTVLELGSGGGNNASHMKQHFAMTLVDLSASMLEVSRRLNPECEHVQGDMRDVRLGQQFDAVFIHDAIEYMATREDLARALATVREHVKPGGAVLLVPDATRETFTPGTDHGGWDGDGRSMRYLEWSLDAEPDAEQCVTDYVLLMQEAGAAPRVVHERHVHGLFSEDTWLELCAAAGIPGRRLTVHHIGVGEAPVFLCRRG